MVPVIRGFEFEVHQIDRASSASNEEYLHDSVVDADEVRHEVEISRNEDNQKQSLAFARDSSAGASLPYFEEKEDDGKQVRQIPHQSEQIHPVNLSATLTVSLNLPFLKQIQNF